MSRGVWERRIADTPVVVVDTETTGLYAGGDRVIEISVVRIDPHTEPRLVLDTLVNPDRSVGATEIHGITDEDVADAPRFSEIATFVVEALRGAVFSSYNVYFDARFLREEMRRAGVRAFPPHLCLMYLRPMLGLGRKCSLGDACHQLRVPHGHAHHAGADALAAAALWRLYLSKCASGGIETFGDLARLKSYKFTSSFEDSVFIDGAPPALPPSAARLKSRRQQPASAPLPVDRVAVSDRQPVLSDYWDALLASIADVEITPYEVFYLKAKQAALGLRQDEVRWLHARAFSAVLADMCQDKAVSTDEALALSGIAAALRELGWAPGDEVASLS